MFFRLSIKEAETEREMGCPVVTESRMSKTLLTQHNV